MLFHRTSSIFIGSPSYGFPETAKQSSYFCPGLVGNSRTMAPGLRPIRSSDCIPLAAFQKVPVRSTVPSTFHPSISPPLLYATHLSAAEGDSKSVWKMIFFGRSGIKEAGVGGGRGVGIGVEVGLKVGVVCACGSGVGVGVAAIAVGGGGSLDPFSKTPTRKITNPRAKGPTKRKRSSTIFLILPEEIGFWVLADRADVCACGGGVTPGALLHPSRI